MTLRLPSSLLLLFFFSASAWAQTPIDVYILAGHSNADGRGIIQNSPAQWQNGWPNALIFWEGTPGWVPIPGSGTSVSTCCFLTQADQLGSEVALGWYLDEHSTNKVGIIKSAQGSSSLAVNWKPTPTIGSSWVEFEDDYADAMSALVTLGYTATVKGFAWVGGENDCTDAAETAAYETNLTTLISEVRTLTGVPALPIVVWEVWGKFIVPGCFPYPGDVAAAQAAVAAADPNVTLVIANPDDGTGMTGRNDNVHFNAADTGYHELGRRLGGAFIPHNPGVELPALPRLAIFFGLLFLGAHRLR